MSHQLTRAPTHEDSPNLRYLSLDQADAASGICNVMRDYWWVVHPERGLAFWQRDTKQSGLRGASPWGNKNKAITEKIRDMHFPWASVQEVPLVLVSINPKDFA